MPFNCSNESSDLDKTVLESITSLQSSMIHNLNKIKAISDAGLINANKRPNVSQQIQISPIDSSEVYEYLDSFNPDEEDTEKPWKVQPYYFQIVHVSMQAMTKMLTHAVSGGSIEIMGMLVGYHKGNEFFVLDCYPLPVEGTESRVNPQDDSYEFMLKYLTKLRESGLRKEQIIGWYHSHPGFGCWLSGIDVQTQKLHQGFEDPYLAIVVDPLKSIKDGEINIGAFRTFYDNHDTEANHDTGSLGWHSKDYYPLDIKLLVNKLDRFILEEIDDNRPQYTKLVIPEDPDIIKSLDINKKNLPDTECNGIQTWKKFNDLFKDVSLDALKAKKSTIDRTNSIDQMSIYSSGVDVKMSNYDISAPASVRNFDRERNETLGNDEDITNFDLATIGAEMDIISINELKKLMIKQAQYKLFRD